MQANARLFSFAAGAEGPWQVTALRSIIGDGLPKAERLSVVPGELAARDQITWVLRGVTSNERYVTCPEKAELVQKSPALARPEANVAVLIPIRKNAGWWALTQDERRTIFEEQSRDTQIGLEFLPAIARRLHHCRDLSSTEPFDFLTWFEFAEEHSQDFDRLLMRLRASEEWNYVEREVEIRLAIPG